MSECEFCNVKLNAMPFICPKCGKHFCSDHKIPKNHECKNINAPVIVDDGLVKHDAKEQEHSKYIDEEVIIIKRRLGKGKHYGFAKFFAALWTYNLVIFVLILFGVGLFLQTSGRYDVKGEIANFTEKFGITIPFLKGEVLKVNETLTKVIEEVKPIIKASDMSLIERIQENPKIYLGRIVEVEALIKWSEKKVNFINFEYRAIDDNGKYLYFVLSQNKGFNEYSKYRITGVLKKEQSTYYIDASDIRKI